MNWKKWLLFAIAVGCGALIWWVFELPTMTVRDAKQGAAPVDVAPSPLETPTVAQPTPASPPAAASDAELPPPVDLDAADRDLDLFGTVMNEARAPIAGALVEVVTYPWMRAKMLVDLERAYTPRVGPTTKSAVDGTFSLRLERGMTVRLRVTAAGYAQTERTFCLAGERVEIVMGQPAALEVIVADPTGAPAADVKLSFTMSDRSAGRYSQFESRRGVTDERGRCLFADLQLGEGGLHVEHARWGWPKTWEFPPERILIDQPGTKTIQVQLYEGRTISGHVRDASTGNPIANARVGPGWTLSRAVVTDQEGRYEFLGFTGGSNEFVAIAEGYGRQAQPILEDAPIDFALLPGDQLRARLVSESGEPIENACVTAVASEFKQQVPPFDDSKRFRWQEIDIRSASSEHDGSITITSLRIDLKHTLVIQSGGFGRCLFYFGHEMAADGIIDLGAITIPSGQRIEGMVVSTAGEPISRALVELKGHNTDLYRFNEGTDRLSEQPRYGAAEEVASDDLGRFRFDDLAPGEYVLSCAPAENISVVLAPGQDVCDLRFEIERGKPLTVRLVDTAGTPMAGLRCSFHIGKQSFYERPNSEGEVKLRGVPSGEFALRVMVPDDYMPPPILTVARGGHMVTVMLEAASQISGVVQTSSGALLGGLELTDSSSPDAWDANSTTTAEDGSFKLRVPLRDSIDIEALGKIGDTIWRGAARSVVPPASDVVIRAEPVDFDRALKVRVFNYDGSPLAGISIRLSGKNVQTPSPPPKTEQDGWVILSGLPAVELGVFCSGSENPLPEDAVEPALVRITPNGQEVTFQYRRGVVMRGRTVNEQGNPIAGALLSGWSSSDNYGFSTSSDANGVFAFALQPGSTMDVFAQTIDAERNSIRGRLDGVTDRSGEITIVIKKP